MNTSRSPRVGHDDRVRRQRIEQLVRINDAVNGLGQCGGAVHEQRGVRSQRLDLRGARGRRLFDERQANGGIELGVVASAPRRGCRATGGHCPRRPRQDRKGLGSGFRALEENPPEPVSRTRHISANCFASSSPNIGPDIDAGKKIARASGLLGRAGVVAELRMVERDLHELREADGAARPDAIGYQLAECQQPLLPYAR